MPAPAGTVVSIHYDTWRIVRIGDMLVTGTGRTYVVVDRRRQERGKHRGRWHLRCLVLDEEDAASMRKLGRNVHTMEWYARGRRRR